MLGGPTVRRIHRDREQREAARRGLADEPSPVASAGGHHSVRFRMLGRAVAGRAAPPRTERAQSARSLAGRSARAADGAACPLRMADILGLGSADSAAVIDGDIVAVEKAQVGGMGLTQSSYHAIGGNARTDLAARVDHSISHQLAAIEQWARTRGANARYAPLDRHGPRPSRQSGAQIARFVHERLIPALEQGGDPGQRQISRSRITISAHQLLPRLERSFAFVGSCWFELVPFLGTPQYRQFHLRRGQGEFLGIRASSRTATLRRYDRILKQVVEETFGAETREGPDLFVNQRYRVIRTPAGRYFLSQRILPYAIEGRDAKLYWFGEAEFGIQITGLRPAEVFTPYGVRVYAEHYPHMFVDSLGGALVICMPRSQTYFRGLFRLPLEEALQRHLESARLTLCAGYVPENSLLHPIHVLGRKTISEGEALRLKVPVYRYYRSTVRSTAQSNAESA